jgi:hypothetical protein
MRNDAPDLTITSICHLLPTMLHTEKAKLKSELTRLHPQLQILALDPVFPRKHITIHLQGPWQTLLRAKETLANLVDPAFKRIWQPSYKTFEEF